MPAQKLSVHGVGILDVLGIERTHVIGSSLGAAVGLNLAANYPERVRSLIAEGSFYKDNSLWNATMEAVLDYGVIEGGMSLGSSLINGRRSMPMMRRTRS